MRSLRQQMIDIMEIKQLAEKTQQSYLRTITSLAKYCRRSPDKLIASDIQQYQLYLIKERHLATSSCRVQIQAIRFFYRYVLDRPEFAFKLHYPKKEQKIPELLTRSEALSIVSFPKNLKHKMLLRTCYGCGLRVSEVVGLRIKDIDGERHLLRVEQGKGRKDRLIPLSDTLLTQLREYWRLYRTCDSLFVSDITRQTLHISTVQHVYKAAKKRLGINKKGGIHGLRHAYATHQLESGLPIYLLQRWLGHADLHSTMRYIHWVPNYQAEGHAAIDLLAEDDEL